MTKLVQGGQVTIRDLLMAGAIRDNISPGSQIALVNTMAQKDHEGDRVRFTEFKSAFRQTFVVTPPQIRSLARIPRRLIIETKRIDHDPGNDPGTAIRTDPEGGPTASRQGGEELPHQGLITIPGQVTLIQAFTAGAPREQIF